MKIIRRIIEKISEVLSSDVASTIIAIVELSLTAYLLLELAISLAGWIAW